MVSTSRVSRKSFVRGMDYDLDPGSPARQFSQVQAAAEAVGPFIVT